MSKGRLPPYAVNTYLFSSQPCEATFRSARSLTGPFSSITNFTVHQFLSKVEKISILNHIKSVEENSTSSCSLKFPAHHKNRHSLTVKSTSAVNKTSFSIEDIERIIKNAYEQAQRIVKNYPRTKALEKNDLDDLNSLSSFLLEKKKRFIITDHSSLNSQLLDEDSSEDESSDYDDLNEECHDFGSDDSDNSADEESTQNDRLTTSKQTFSGMRIYDTINPSNQAHYFKVSINDEIKYINKQTAARLLTINKNRLSSDRLSRVRDMNKQN